MRLKLKLIAAAAALASLAGGAQAAITQPGSGNGSLVLVAYDQVNRNWYMRDLGFFFQTFLPNQVTLLSGEGGVTGDKTPEAGLMLDKTNTPTFADASFGTWLGQQTAANVRWFVSAVDDFGSSTTTNLKRMITSSANPGETATNGQIDGYISSANAGGLGVFWNEGSDPTNALSNTGGNASTQWDINFNMGADGLAMMDQTVNLFYFGRTVGTGSTTTLANGGIYQNSFDTARIHFASSGDLTYEVSAVPLPPAAWMLGAGLMAIGGFVRRRKQGQAV